jgi:hypothetical protein
MAQLSTADLARIRDEVGTSDPTNADLTRSFAELGHWLPVAIRVLKRRRSAAGMGGGVSQVTVPGAIGVTLAKADIASLDSQIERLERLWDVEQGISTGGVSFSRLTRTTAR